MTKKRTKYGGRKKGTKNRVKYEKVLQEEDKDKLWERLKERLERLRPDKMLERKALEAENLNKSLQFRPLGHHWNVI